MESNSSEKVVKSKGVNVWKPMIYALVLVIGILLGLMLTSINNGKKVPFAQVGYDKIDDILTFVRLKYVDTVNTEALYETAIQDMLSSLDPHSNYIPASDLARENESLEGNFEGVGIEFHIMDDTIIVVSPISGGPSEEVGIKAGDRIVFINDTTVAGIKIKNEDVLKKLRGAKGTKVKVGIVRNGGGKVYNYTIIRNKIPLYSVDAAFMLNDETGYIRINRFSATTYEEFTKGIRKLNEQGLKKLIVDVRQNGGGYLNAAAEIADELLTGEKLIVYTKGNAYKRQDYVGARDGLFEKGALTILVDQGSASASEILAGAIQDWDRGTIVGRSTFGKGLVQEQYRLGDGSALRLTVARYYTPSGRCIQKSYDKGKEAYNEAIYKRYEDGSLLHEDSVNKADSLIFKTAKGRVVYGGGGIRPDVFVPFDSTIFNVAYAEASSFIAEFTYKYYPQHQPEVEKFKDLKSFAQHFVVSDELYNNYLAFAKQQGMKADSSKLLVYQSKIKSRIKAFFGRQRWQNEGYIYLQQAEDLDLKRALEKI
jgi:carboxyl-terminal processing protease